MGLFTTIDPEIQINTRFDIKKLFHPQYWHSFVTPAMALIHYGATNRRKSVSLCRLHQVCGNVRDHFSTQFSG
jgi:hypothetical protein